MPTNHDLSLHGSSWDARIHAVAQRSLTIQEDQSKSSLLLAAARGELERVQTLLTAGGDPNVRNDLGQTPLHWAVGGGHADVANALLKAGADPGARDNDGQTPLHVAARKGELEIAKVLLKEGADPHARDNDGLTSRQWATRNGYENIVNSLVLDADTDPNTTNNLDQASLDTATAVLQSSQANVDLDLPIMTSKIDPAKSNKALIAEATCCLIHENKEMPRYPVSDFYEAKSETELLNTIKFFNFITENKENDKILEFLEENEIEKINNLVSNNKNAKNKLNELHLFWLRDKNEPSWSVGQKLLYRAVFAGHTELVKALIEEGTPCEEMRLVSLYYWYINCQFTENSDLPKDSMRFPNLLTEAAASIYSVDTKTHILMSPLHCAALAGHIHVVNVLIQVAGDTLNRKTNPYSWSPLHCAARKNHADVASALIQAGADLESKDSGEETPLCLALRHCNEEVASVLIQAGADMNTIPHIECRCP